MDSTGRITKHFINECNIINHSFIGLQNINDVDKLVFVVELDIIPLEIPKLYAQVQALNGKIIPNMALEKFRNTCIVRMWNNIDYHDGHYRITFKNSI